MTRTISMRSGLAIAAAIGLSTHPAAASTRISRSDAFSIGSQASGFCEVQAEQQGQALPSIFDNQYRVLCRDASAPIARIYAFRGSGDDGYREWRERVPSHLQCGPERALGSDFGKDAVVARCKRGTAEAGLNLYKARQGNRLFVAEGLEAYSSVISLAVRSLLRDRVQPGEISIPVTSATDVATFARLEAASLDLDAALTQGYGRNNAGEYAQSAEFFEMVSARLSGEVAKTAESRAALALQRSNLGRFGEADQIFSEIDPSQIRDSAQRQLVQNFAAAHLINTGRYAEALAQFDTNDPAASSGDTHEPGITLQEAQSLNGASLFELMGGQGELAKAELKARILDAQSAQLRGTALRLSGNPGDAQAALGRADQILATLPVQQSGAFARLRTQILLEQATLDDAAGDHAGAEAKLSTAMSLLSGPYALAPAAIAIEARFAAHLAQAGNPKRALETYRSLLAKADALPSGSGPKASDLQDFFRLLADRGDRQSVAELFAASQFLTRPGVAQTQALLARGLGEGSDEAAQLFRASLDLTREVERVRQQFSAGSEPAQADQLRGRIAMLEEEQTATLAKLAQFPRYRALATQRTGLDELQAALREGENYWKLTAVGDDLYGFLIKPGQAEFYVIDLKVPELRQAVAELKNSISVSSRAGTQIVPFDVALSHELFTRLAGPVADKLQSARHLIFEPDDAMFQLPLAVLVTDARDVQAYGDSLRAGGDPFDFRPVRWLGSKVDLSTSVSARSFLDVRASQPSRAAKEYLGLGENVVPQATSVPSSDDTRSADCAWPLRSWRKPISARELEVASAIFGSGKAATLTGEAFTDTAILAHPEVGDYRILHFATHGLTGAPRAGCPSQPALMTSFGDERSDGLLSFEEIFDLKLDADLILLSACDTATQATAAATRAAGISGGGDFPLDGLVRAFVGAGARMVLATDWAIPDDFNATEKLITQLFRAGEGASVASALRESQLLVSREAETSHPFYWAAFVLVGDGARPLMRN